MNNVNQAPHTVLVSLGSEASEFHNDNTGFKVWNEGTEEEHLNDLELSDPVPPS